MEEESCKKSLQSAMQKIDDLNYEIASLKAAARVGEASASERSFCEETESESESLNLDDAQKVLTFDEQKLQDQGQGLVPTSLDMSAKQASSTSTEGGQGGSSSAVEEASFITLNLNLRKEVRLWCPAWSCR